MTVYDIIFYAFAVLTIGLQVSYIFEKYYLFGFSSLLFFPGVAGIYVLLNADFIAITQLLIYVGGIMILVIFG